MIRTCCTNQIYRDMDKLMIIKVKDELCFMFETNPGPEVGVMYATIRLPSCHGYGIVLCCCAVHGMHRSLDCGNCGILQCIECQECKREVMSGAAYYGAYNKTREVT